MALKKKITTQFKTEADYWRIDRFIYNRMDKNIVVYLGLYVDRDASSDPSVPPFETKELQIDLSQTSLESNFASVLYSMCKTGFFEDAEDC